MKRGLFVAAAIFITICITVLDIVSKCYCQIVKGILPYCYTDVFAISGAIKFPCFILLLRCVDRHVFKTCVYNMHMLSLCMSDLWSQHRPPPCVDRKF